MSERQPLRHRDGAICLASGILKSRTMRKTFRYRLYPTKAQAETLDRQLGLCRELYNAAVQERRDGFSIGRVSVSFNAQSAQLPEIKAERPELESVYSQVLQDVLHRVDKNFK